MECIDGTQAHYWIIESSKGSISKGTCNKCNQVKKFTNSISAVTSWGTNSKQTYSNKMVGKDKKDG